MPAMAMARTQPHGMKKGSAKNSCHVDSDWFQGGGELGAREQQPEPKKKGEMEMEMGMEMPPMQGTRSLHY